MRAYVIRRILLLIPTLLIASFFVAGLARILPGDALQAYLGAGRDVSSMLGEQELAILKAKLGLDKPFVVQYVAFILGWPNSEGRVLRTSFGENVWRELGEFAADPVTDITFINDKLGWSAGSRVIWGSTDAGRTWSPQERADERVNALAVADEDHVWAVGPKGMIIHSNEGGKPATKGAVRVTTWTTQPSGVTEEITDIVAADIENLWAVGAKGTILHTFDGGTTWQSQNSGTDVRLTSIAFNDAQNGLAVGAGGTILRTSDGGSNWISEESGTTEDLTAVAVDGDIKAIAVGSSGTVALSDDGGITWSTSRVTYVDSSGDLVTASERLRTVGLVDAQRAFAMGDNGIALETRDGGQTWQRLPLIDRDGLELSSRNLTAAWAIVSERTGEPRYFAASSTSFWEWGAIGGNLGKSLVGTRTVAQDLTRTLAPTLQLGIMTTLLSTAVAIPLGILSAVRQDTFLDYAARTVAISGLAIPSFWLGTLVILLPAVYLDWSPPLQYVFFFDNPIANLKFYAIPVMVGGLFGSASVMRMTRSMMLEVLRQDYVRTAWSKGLRERMVIYRHALKNALIPVLTIVGLQVPFILGGLVIIERLFSIPGIGRLLLDAVRLRDYPVIQGINLFFAAAVLTSNLLVDMTYGWLDPRIRYT